jgi:hypothetical protein
MYTMTTSVCLIHSKKLNFGGVFLVPFSLFGQVSSYGISKVIPIYRWSLAEKKNVYATIRVVRMAN